MPLSVWSAVFPLAAGFIADLLLGDPRRFPHPVRLFGAASLFLERVLRPLLRRRGAVIGGGILLVVLIGGGTLIVVLSTVRAATAADYRWGALVSAALIYTAIAVRDMLGHIKKVDRALAEKNLAVARRQVSHLVSRETAGLDQTDIVRAALESLFENQADGVTAPLFFGALGGAPLAMFYKAVNTLDSMVGYKNPTYRYWGWASARLDDLLSYIPARLSALCLLLAGFTMGTPWRRALPILRRDRLNHDSPNSAWPEAAGAAVLNIQLGGADQREGRTVIKPLINAGGNAPAAADLKRGRQLFGRASLVAFIFNLALAALWWSALFRYFSPEVR